MTVKIRFFARFRELLGTDILLAWTEGTILGSVVREVAKNNQEGYDAIFDAGGSFREFVILIRNGTRIETAEAEKTLVGDGDEIAVFPPVAGG